MKKVLLLLFISLLVALAACNRGNDGELTEAEAAALAYAEAVLGNEDQFLNENTCANVPAGSTSLDMYALFTIGMAIRNSVTFTPDDLVLDLEARTESEEGDEAMIRITGSATYPADLPASELAPLPVDETTQLDEVWRMQRENGIWKWCGGTEN